jgi:Secretion system C-terminal sorting domain/Reeler domain
MKKRILLFTAFGAMSFFMLTSEQEGPALFHNNRTGAKGSTTTCGGSGCHGGTNVSTAVTITVDSGSTAVTHYVPGHAYTIKIHGTSTTGNNFFGFQFASVSGSGTSQVQAGTASGLPTNVGGDSYSSLVFVEHNAALAATSAGVYDVSFTWTAPSTAVGNITLYCTLNAVNGDGSAGSADQSNNTSVTLAQEPTSTGVASVSAPQFNAYPNPVSNTLNIQAAEAGTYDVQVYDLNGRSIASETMTINGSASLNTANWAPGMYFVSLSKDGGNTILHVVKQ